jgi:hypothetical protein
LESLSKLTLLTMAVRASARRPRAVDRLADSEARRPARPAQPPGQPPMAAAPGAGGRKGESRGTRAPRAAVDSALGGGPPPANQTRVLTSVGPLTGGPAGAGFGFVWTRGTGSLTRDASII